jgi:DNA-binding NtrC family response regulator
LDSQPLTNNQEQLIGKSIQITEIRQIIRQVAPTDITVLITGESGVGKEVAAKEIHRLSKRNKMPFITVNCGAIPEGIIESELFGHQKGSFTGAIDTRRGYFELANKGTIFLDEIGELPLSTQVKFLRIIENGEYMKVGGSKTERIDVRIIAATNKDLEHQISIKAFREDLYYRLRSINVHIPPLRERREDISLLFDYFVKSFCKKNSVDFKDIDDKALDYIINFDWPGNARQLRNFTESLLTLHSGKKIELDDVLNQLNISRNGKNLPAPLMSFKGKDEREFLFRALFELKTDIIDIKNQLENMNVAAGTGARVNGFAIPESKLETITYDDFEQELLTYYWNKYDGNINKIAKKLHLSYKTLYRKYKLYGLKNGRG